MNYTVLGNQLICSSIRQRRCSNYRSTTCSANGISNITTDWLEIYSLARYLAILLNILPGTQL